MRFQLTIDLGNDAMTDGYDVSEALRRVADQLVADYGTNELKDQRTAAIFDFNGARVGTWKVTD